MRPHGLGGHVAGWVMAHRSSNRRRNQWVVSLLDVQPADRVLEIGYGPGIAVAELSRRASRGMVMGIDHSEVMRRAATRRNAAAVRAGRVDLRLGSVESLPDFGEPFDTILSVNSMGFWTDPVAACAPCGARCAPAGRSPSPPSRAARAPRARPPNAPDRRSARRSSRPASARRGRGPSISNRPWCASSRQHSVAGGRRRRSAGARGTPRDEPPAAGPARPCPPIACPGATRDPGIRRAPRRKGEGMSEPQSQRPPTTTDAGIPVASQEHSLTVGPDGPSCSRTSTSSSRWPTSTGSASPSANPTPRAGVPSGASSSRTTCAPTRRRRCSSPAPRRRWSCASRRSPASGAHPTPGATPRGFAVKFYTSEGNLDIVGNNTPVFFIRDPLKFQNFIRSQKRLAANNLRDADMQWDFWTLSPESSHQVTWLMGDRGIPRSWRHMNGYSSHTYMWVNDGGERFWVKYHFKTDQGVEFLTQAEADRIAGEDADYHQRDLYEAIERREFPSWSLKMQIMPFDEAKTYRFNPFDLTKVWPHADYPLVDVGRLTLDRNVTDYHTEMEQAAFQPNNTVPGTGLSPDKMLLARGFSYADAHRARLGVNYQQIPVNRPKAPVRSYPRTERCAWRTSPTRSTTRTRSTTPRPPTRTRYAEDAVWAANGEMVRAAATLHAEDDDFGQAHTLVNEVLDDAARDRLVDNVSGILAGLRRPEVLQRAFEYWRNIDKAVGDRIDAATMRKRTA